MIFFRNNSFANELFWESLGISAMTDVSAVRYWLQRQIPFLKNRLKSFP